MKRRGGYRLLHFIVFHRKIILFLFFMDFYLVDIAGILIFNLVNPLI